LQAAVAVEAVALLHLVVQAVALAAIKLVRFYYLLHLP
jgi:hypothetical protein